MRAREVNRARVAEMLTAAGIDFFTVPTLDDRSTAVAVREDARDAVFEALTADLGLVPGYISALASVSGAKERLEYCAGGRPITLGNAHAVRVTRFVADETESLVCGHEFGCVIEFWRVDGEDLVAPRANKVTTRVPARHTVVPVAQHRFTRLYSAYAALPQGVEPTVPSLPEFDCLKTGDIDFPIDVVYTWVDGTDPEWAKRKAEVQGTVYHEESASDARFLSRDELRYSVRSLHAFAPWVRCVHIVTDDQTPAWLAEGQTSVRTVSHREIFSDSTHLPTFNSHSIESQLHHIDGLSEHFLYFNDDMFLGRPIAPQAFFTPSGMTKYFPAGARIALGPVTENDTPVDAACKNNRALLERTFGRVISQPMDHIPYALSRSVMRELEERYPDEYARTAGSKFRALTDLSVTSSLAHYYGLLTGRAIAGSVQYGYVHLAHPELASRLAQMLLRRDRDAFCLNDSFSSAADIEVQNAVISPFLDAYLPVPSPAERVPSWPSPTAPTEELN
ncbi:stealth family protein [Yinghuangia sp. YIM S09857]|uniref:stealth family protein n=1 Tax=Yinghuangia sp. YIM S09857 TaxID=3436929 RepID=UPI003F52F0D6